MTDPGGGAGRRTPTRTRVVTLAVRAARLEVLMYASIVRAVARRPAVPAGARGFRYDSSVLLLLGVLIVVSGVEVVAFDLVLRSWPLARVLFLVLGIWGFVWMVGLLCAHVTRPHTVGPDGVRVRDGMDLDAAVDWAAVQSVRLMRQTHQDKPPRLLAEHGGHVLVVAVADETNVEVTLTGPTAVRLPGRPPTGGMQVVDGIRLWADDPRGFVTEAQSRLETDRLRAPS